MKLLKSEQIRDWDNYTVVQKKINSYQLMEIAAATFTNWFQSLYFDKSRKIYVLCGPGNNGGDGMCVAKILTEDGYKVQTDLFLLGSGQSSENKKAMASLPQILIKKTPELGPIGDNDIIIDAILGSGLRGEVKGEFLELIKSVNKTKNTVVSVDIPSGMNGDGRTVGHSIKCDRVLSFEIPKIAFFLTDNANAIKSWDYRPIHLAPEFILQAKVNYHYLDYPFVKSLLKNRDKTASKYEFGFGQLCGGSEGMYGALILGAKAAMRCGIGRLTVTLPKQYSASLIAAIPEVMVSGYPSANQLLDFRLANDQVNAVAVGPALSTSDEATHFIDALLNNIDIPLIIDADGLNIIARNQWQHRFPRNTVITPHHKEFSRLFGESQDHFSMIQLQIAKAKEHGIYIILKGKYTSIATPEGICYFNNTGNVGMATAGSGDVLTGMLLSLLCQGYAPLESCALAVYIHGSAGDRAALKYGVTSMMASDILKSIPETLKNLHGN